MDIDLKIRDGKLSDAADLAALMCELGYGTAGAEMESRLISILKDPRYKTLVVLNDDKICGMIGTFTCYTYEHNSPSARILALVVSEKMRGRGVGRALIDAAEKDLARKNISRIAVNTRFERKDAHEFYEKLGYTKNGFRLVKELPRPAD